MVNRDEIKELVCRVVGYSQDIPQPQVDELLDNWLEAKRDFIELFGGELIYEYPEKVAFEIGPREKSLRVNDFIQLVRNTYENDALADFISENKEGFFTNKVLHNYSSENITVNQGMKLLRAFKFFEDDPVVLNKLQSAASMIIQENKVEGRLCLSVHPLDYLSSSENNHNWRSCHALDGEYRSGNLSYMQDSATVVCYLKSDKDERLPNFPPDVLWNSKKWRVLLFFSDTWDMMFAGRQYPFSTEAGIEFVRSTFLPSIGIDNWTEWTDKLIKSMYNAGEEFYFSSPYIPVGKKLRQLKAIIQDADHSLHYNDLLYSSCYSPMYAYRTRRIGNGNLFIEALAPDEKIISTKNETMVHIGHSCKCLRCGKETITMTESMMCENCELEYGTEDREDYGTCPCCGRRFIFDDGGWVSGGDNDGEIVCPSCYDEYTRTCACCDETFYTDDMIWDRDNEEYLCKYCWEERKNG